MARSDDIEVVAIDFERLESLAVIPIFRFENKRLVASVKSDGTTRVLKIFHRNIQASEIGYTIFSCNYQLKILESFIASYRIPPEIIDDNFRRTFFTPINADKILDELRQEQSSEKASSFSDFDSYTPYESLFGKGIYSPFKLLVEVIEAKELRPSAPGRVDKTFCKLFVQNSSSQFASISSFMTDKVTDISEKSSNPTWHDQKFVFDVPELAASSPIDKLSLRIVVKGKALLESVVLGEVNIKLSYFSNSVERDGWYSLKLQSISDLAHQMEIKNTDGDSQNDASNNVGILSTSVGSIRLKIRWINSHVAFHEYFLSMLERFESYYNISILYFNELPNLNFHAHIAVFRSCKILAVC